MTYLVRYIQHTGSGSHAIYRETDPEHLQVAFKGRYKRTGKTLGGFALAEHAGWDKSTVILKSRGEHTLSSRGKHVGIQSQAIKLIDRHKSIRTLRPEDVQVLEIIDERIAAKEAEVKAIRDERHAAVEAAWRRAEKVDIAELEELANHGIN